MADSKSKIFFYSHQRVRPYACFSNFYHAPFRYRNIMFHSSEQAFMYMKAKTMNDIRSCTKIAHCESPGECKRLGRQVKPYDDKLWAERRYDIMVAILECKFSQNGDIGAMLKETGDAVIAEASPTDRVWGIGISLECAYRGVPWRGDNLLGKALMEVRARLRDNDDAK